MKNVRQAANATNSRSDSTGRRMKRPSEGGGREDAASVTLSGEACPIRSIIWSTKRVGGGGVLYESSNSSHAATFRLWDADWSEAAMFRRIRSASSFSRRPRW